MQENPLPPPKAPNKELIEHEQKRKVEAQLFKLAKELRQKEGMSEEDIENSVNTARVHLLEKLKTAPTMVNVKESHQAALAKEKHMDKLKNALGIREDFEFGAAFDLEL